jgi:hypothetical protein
MFTNGNDKPDMSVLDEIAATEDGSTAISTGETVEPIFDDNNNYNKTNWLIDDIISVERLNKIEEALSMISKFERTNNLQSVSSYNVLHTMIAHIYSLLDTQGISIIPAEVNEDNIILSTHKYQSVKIEKSMNIVLPNFSGFAEVHLFLTMTGDYDVTLPAVKKQDDMTFAAGSTYELIFTHTTEWLYGCIEYK